MSVRERIRALLNAPLGPPVPGRPIWIYDGAGQPIATVDPYTGTRTPYRMR